MAGGIGPKFWALCAKRAEDFVCGNHVGFHDRDDRVDRILDILLPYGNRGEGTGHKTRAARGRSSDGGSAAWAFPGRARLTLTII